MLVPFTFSLRTDAITSFEFHEKEMHFLGAKLCLENKWPIIAHERYFQSIDDWSRVGVTKQWLEDLERYWCGKAITQEEMDSLDKYVIPTELENEILTGYSSKHEAWTDLLIENNVKLEDYVEQLIYEIEIKYNRPIKAFLCPNSLPVAVRKAAERHGISMIHYDCGWIRSFGAFRLMTTWFDFRNICSSASAELFQQRYESFRAGETVSLLSRKGLTRLIIANQYQRDIHSIDAVPQYELGLILPSWMTEEIAINTLVDSDELCWRAFRQYAQEDVLVRARPGWSYGKATDDSPSVFHMATKCKRLAGVMTSGMCDALLVGRSAHNYGNYPFSLMMNKGIEDTSVGITPLEYINFIVFAYFCPIMWSYSVDYINFRLSSPSEAEIYRKTFKYYTEGISPENLQLYYMTSGREYHLGDTLYFDDGHFPHQYADYYFSCTDGSNGGFGQREVTHIWSEGQYSEFMFDLVGEKNVDIDVVFLLLDVRCGESSRLACYANSQPVGEMHIEPDTKQLLFTIPSRLIDDKQKLTLKLEYDCCQIAFISMRLSKTELDSFERGLINQSNLYRLERDRAVAECNTILTDKEALNSTLHDTREMYIAEIKELTEQSTAITAELNAITHSTSWFVTRPFRVVMRLLRRILGRRV